MLHCSPPYERQTDRQIDIRTLRTTIREASQGDAVDSGLASLALAALALALVLFLALLLVLAG